MPDWIFNDGSAVHRGVWHTTESIRYETIPEHVWEQKNEIRDWHLDKCGLNERLYDYVKRAYTYGTECTCGHTGDVIGSYLQRHITPEYIKAFAIIPCGAFGSKDNRYELSSGSPIHKWFKYRQKHKDGDVVEIVDRIQPPLVFSHETDLPIGPVCSRCEAIAFN